MQIQNKSLIIFATILLTALPHPMIAELIKIESLELKQLVILTLQVLSILFLTITYLRTSARALKLFWQFIVLALSLKLIANILFNNEFLLPNYLQKEFFSLFSYFFIILAIETAPHISTSSETKNVVTRLTSLFFTLVCFSYFVLLPVEFANSQLEKVASMQLFHLIINSLIFVRLLSITYYCFNRAWCRIYITLVFAASATLLNNIIHYQSFTYGTITSDYVTNLLSFIPYCALILAANFSISAQLTYLVARKSIMPEVYILLLSAIFVALHIIGIEQSLHYISQNLLQAGLLFIWLFIAIGLLIYTSWQKLQLSQKQLQQLNQHADGEKQLLTLNQQLSHAIINSEDKAIVSVSNNAILTASIDGKVLSANPAAVQMFQALEQDIIGSDVNQFFSANDQMHYFFKFKTNVYKLQRKETGISVECMSVKKDGSEFPVQAELQWADREQKPLIVITFINLTARKLAEQQTLDLKDKFIANISHEFRTPLTIINGILDRYLIKTESEKEGIELKTAKRNGLRLVRMVEQLLELSRLANNPKLTLATYRLHTLMAMPIDSFSRLAKQSQLNFNYDIPKNLWLDCDAQAFEKIIFNLLANAIKYTPEHGNIVVSAQIESNNFLLNIVDNGIGIDNESQLKIFERFHRTDETQSQGIFGVGIGLSLVQELVKAHGWQINVTSALGKGSKFTLTIPIAPALSNEQQIPNSVSQTEVSSLILEQQKAPKTYKKHSQKVILVIEDNLDMQSHIKQVLSPSHHCLLAESGEQGLTLAQEYIPDLIVCDIMLTGIDGFAVLKQLKSHELTTHIPVIMLTARSDLDSRLHGLNLQADEYLSKPFNHQELLTRIDNLITNRIKLQQGFQTQLNKKQQQERKSSSIENAEQLTQQDNEALSLDQKFLDKLEKTTAQVYMNTELDIVQLAAHMAMSERQLQRKLKVLLGITPNQFIKEFRLKKAKLLLQNGSQIGRIALDVGFSSQTYFGRCFKEMFACTPKQYQQQQIEKQRESNET